MKFLTCLLIIAFPLSALGQEPEKLYNPNADAAQDLSNALQIAREQNKQVLVQVGGNWCSWCIRLHGFFESEAKIDSILYADYVLVRINYSPENKNPQMMASLGYPQRFGFPVLLVLDQQGQRLHTQDTGLLELNKGYDPEKVMRFLLSWNRAATDPLTYTNVKQ